MAAGDTKKGQDVSWPHAGIPLAGTASARYPFLLPQAPGPQGAVVEGVGAEGPQAQGGIPSQLSESRKHSGSPAASGVPAGPPPSSGTPWERPLAGRWRRQAPETGWSDREAVRQVSLGSREAAGKSEAPQDPSGSHFAADVAGAEGASEAQGLRSPRLSDTPGPGNLSQSSESHPPFHMGQLACLPSLSVPICERGSRHLPSRLL